jgi:hypothetical protein
MAAHEAPADEDRQTAARAAVEHILSAYALLGLPAETFGHWLAGIAEDFRSGEVDRPGRVN